MTTSATTIHRHRHNVGMTQADLAKAAGLCRNTIIALEQATTTELGRFRIATLTAVARVLGVSVFDLVPELDDN